jgi:hypothetical protein
MNDYSPEEKEFLAKLALEIYSLNAERKKLVSLIESITVKYQNLDSLLVKKEENLLKAVHCKHIDESIAKTADLGIKALKDQLRRTVADLSAYVNDMHLIENQKKYNPELFEEDSDEV